MTGVTSTLCAIAKNEERCVLEWLAFNCLLGFDRIIVYDHGSTDRTRDIVSTAMTRDPRIGLREWFDEPGVITQIAAYEDALATCETTWFAAFDLDEFLVLRRHGSIDALVRSMPEDTGAVAVNWRIFGSSGKLEAEPLLVTARFRRCAPADYFKHRHVKPIVRVEAVESMLIHRVDLAPSFSYRSPGGTPVTFVNNGEVAEIDFEVAQLNHYVLKSRREFEEKKVRGDCSRTPEYRASGKDHRDEKYWEEHDTNEVLDETLGERSGIILKEMQRLS